MTRLVAISVCLIALFSAFIGYSSLAQRRSFDPGWQMVFEMGHQNYELYSIQPNDSFGRTIHLMFDPQFWFGDRYVVGVDCSPDSGSLIFWYVFLYRYDLLNQNLTQLVLGQGLSQQSAWSPDGSRIAYIDDLADRQPREIFIVQADGSHKVQVTTNRQKETSLSWSPDSHQIAFTYSLDTRSGLAVVEVATGHTTTLIDQMQVLNDATWSPDGSRIAFDIDDGERRDIYTI